MLYVDTAVVISRGNYDCVLVVCEQGLQLGLLSLNEDPIDCDCDDLSLHEVV